MIKKSFLITAICLGGVIFGSGKVSADDGIERISASESKISVNQFEEWDRKAEKLTKKIRDNNRLNCNQGYFVEDSEIEDGVYKIKLRDSPLYLDVAYATSKNGQNFNAWTKHNGAAQKFYIKNVGNGEVVIFDLLNWRAMEIQNSNNFDGAKIQLYDVHTLPTQRWKIEVVANRYGELEDPDRMSFRLINVNSSKALDLIGSRQVQGNTFWAWSKVNISSQKFRLQRLTY